MAVSKTIKAASTEIKRPRMFSEDLAVAPRQRFAASGRGISQRGISPRVIDPYSVVNYAKRGGYGGNQSQNLNPTQAYRLVDQRTGQVYTSDPNDPSSLARLVSQANLMSSSGGSKANWAITDASGKSVASDAPNRSFISKALPYLALAVGAGLTGGALGLFGGAAAAGGAAGGAAAGLSGIGAGIGAAGASIGAGLGGLGAAGAGLAGAGALASGLGTAAGSVGAGLGAAGAGALASGLGTAAGSLAGALTPEIVVTGATGAGAGLGGGLSIGNIGAGLAAAGAGINAATAQSGSKSSWQDKASRYLELAGYGSQLLGGVFGGGSGSGSTGAIPTTQMDPLFSAQLPAANLPGGNNLAPRTMPQQNWANYAFGPEQSFFNNVPQPPGYAHGGGVHHGGGGLSHASGQGTGRSDDIQALLSDGEYVVDAETVALLGDGSNKAGADALDKLRVNVRRHKGKRLSKGRFSHNAKRPEQYLSGGLK